LRWSISTKIFIGLTIIIVSFGAVGILGLLRMNQLRKNIELVREGVVPVTGRLLSVVGELKDSEAKLESDNLLPIMQWLPYFKPFDRLHRIEKSIVALGPRFGLDEPERQFLEAVRSRLSDLRNRSDFRRSLESSPNPEIREVLTVASDAQTNEEIYDALSRALMADLHGGRIDSAKVIKRDMAAIFPSILAEVKVVSREFGSFMDTVSLSARQAESESTLIISVATGGALVIAIGVMFWVAFTIRPLQRLQEGARRIGRGDFTAVEITTGDEIGELAAEFNRMALSLGDRDRQLARQREDLLKSERLATIGKMSSQITHEIRNPLSSMGLNSELLEDELMDLADDCTPDRLEECRQLLGAIRGEIDRLTAVTGQYLKFARLPKPDRSSVDLNDLITSLTEFMREELSRYKITRQLDLDASLGVADLDPGQIRQAVLNLIRNAIEAMDDAAIEDRSGPAGRLTIQTRRVGSMIELKIEDDGPGMNAATALRVFDPFFSTKSTGTGLGLSLVQQIVQEHGGQIECRSELGRGTEFLIALPRSGSEGVIYDEGPGGEGDDEDMLMSALEDDRVT
jgi:two-component system NtrC family sensor kinase